MSYYDEIKNKLIDNEIYEKVKDYSKERNRVITYYEVGKLLSDAGKKYGENIIGEYSKKLVIDVGKKYNSRTLRRMRQLYMLFNKQKWSPVATTLTWSHYTELLSINDVNKIEYYIIQISNRNLSKRQLRDIIKNNEYERLSNNVKNKLINKEKLNVMDLVKNPIMIKSNNNNEEISEKMLQKLILEDISSFLKELGTGFTFIDNEYKIKLGNRYNYIDLLLYNYEYNCFVVIELKVTELKKEYIGQIEIYMNYIDNNLRSINQNKTIGIIICRENNQYIIKYCSDKRIITREYKLI